VLALALVLWVGLPGEARAQQPDVRARLVARGLPSDLVDGVVSVATDATARGLPSGPLADKALEGWAKHAPQQRILAVVQQFAGRMGEARLAVQGAGMASPPGEVITAAAEALGRGMSAAQLGSIVGAEGRSGQLAPGLRVAAALTAQGMRMDQAVAVVTGAMRRGRSSDQILDMPSIMRAMQTQGLDAPEIGRRMLSGGGEDHGEGEMGGHRPPPPRRPGERPEGRMSSELRPR
jgi:hypothetical protein